MGSSTSLPACRICDSTAHRMIGDSAAHLHYTVDKSIAVDKAVDKAVAENRLMLA
jgi:hypothetical protein